MKKSTGKTSIWILIAAGFACLCILALAVGGYLLYTRSQSSQTSPVVWMASPRQHQVWKAGSVIPVMAYVRSADQVQKMELWIDGKRVREVSTAEGQAFPPTGLDYTWQGMSEGGHTLVARAVTIRGAEGQATVRVDVLGEEADTSAYIVGETETLDGIAEEYGVSPQELLDANPEAAADGDIGAGEELTVPGGDVSDERISTGEDESVAGPVDGEAAPDPMPSESTGSGFFVQIVKIFMEALRPAAASDQKPLRIELLHLVTRDIYESLHCYIGTTASLPRWYPDTDNDQATDESFILTPGWGWNIADSMAGTNGPIVDWPGNENLTVEITCTGVEADGTEAIETGHLSLVIPPESWDGVDRWAQSATDEGFFQLHYRVSTVEDRPRGIPIDLDRSMTPPINLTLADGTLRWNYSPTPEDDPIDGFLVYFNDNVVWTVPRDARSFRLPEEWNHPLCDVIYNFSVGSVIGVYPDSRESTRSNTVTVESDPDACNRQVRVTFLTLETHDMPGDGHHENRSGEIGPPYGAFVANLEYVGFDGGSLGPGLDSAVGLNSNTVYNLGELATHRNWNFTTYPSVVVDLREGQSFQYRYLIMDLDSGRCHDPDDPGCDDEICRGESMILESEVSLARLDTAFEESLSSTNGRCTLTVRIEPTGEGATGTESGSLAFPLIWLEDIVYDEATGLATISYRNTGTAAWPGMDLLINYLDREGTPLGSDTRSGYSLAAGAADTITFQPPAGVTDVCVAFDPNNTVTEMGETTGAIVPYRPFCQPRSDLEVQSIRYNRASSNLEVGIHNDGEGGVLNRTLQLSIALTGVSTPFTLDVPGFSLEANDEVVVPFPLTPAQRNQMLGINTEGEPAYELTINPEHAIPEEDYDNNSFQVAEARNFSVAWYYGCSDAVVRGLDNHFTMHMIGTINGEGILDWDSPEHSIRFEVGEPNHIYICWNADTGQYYRETGSFTLMGDEEFYMSVDNNVHAGSESYDLGYWAATVDPNQTLDFTDVNYPYYCEGSGGVDFGNGTFNTLVDYPGEDDGRPDPGRWYSIIHVCRLQE
jgi:LysM repeat protein